MQCVSLQGMKAAIGRCLMNRTAIPVSRRSMLKLLQEASALADAFSANGQVKFAVAPRFVFDVGEWFGVDVGLFAGYRLAVGGFLVVAGFLRWIA